MSWRTVALVGCLVPLLGCSSESDGAGGGEPLAALPGTATLFEPGAELESPEHYYDLPTPLDSRLDAQGAPDVRGLPSSGNSLVEQLKAGAADLRGFSTVSVSHFAFDDAVAGSPGEVQHHATGSDADVWLVDVDPDSPDRARRYPLISSVPERDGYVAGPMLSVAPHPGVVLRENTTHAVLVLRRYGDAGGEPLGVPAGLREALRGRGPLAETYAPLVALLPELGVDADDIAAANVFTTGDEVARLRDESELVRARYSPDIVLAGLADGGADHERFCELTGTIELPQFQVGVPPWDEQGFIERDASGLPVEQRTELVPVVVTVPKQPMPVGGYPLVVYAHGSGGLSTQVVDRGPVLEPGGERTPGLGPSHVLAARGFATVGWAMPLNPERLEGADGREYLNINNLAAYPYTWRQSVHDQRLIYDALERLSIDPALLAQCAGPELPAGESEYRLDASQLYQMGQSAGAQNATLLAPVEPRIAALAPTGSGGYFSVLVATGSLVGGNAGAVGLLLGTTATLTHLHPALGLLQAVWEPSDPIVFAPRIGKRPLEGMPPRSLYVPVGEGDSFFPAPVFDAMAIAYDNEQAGENIVPSLQVELGVVGRDGFVDYPVANNRESSAGGAFTSVMVQFRGDGLEDPHGVFAQLDEVKYQYSCFFVTHRERGVATVAAPATVDAPCP